MRILLVTPSARPATTGNATTAARWASELEGRGHECLVRAAPATWTARDFLRAAFEARPDVIHLHHAARCGRFVDEARALAAVVLSFAGTDLAPGAPAATVRRAASRAHVLVAGGDEPATLVASVLPELAPRVRGVPRGVLLGTAPFDLRRRIGAGPGDLVVVLPAGVRPVKAPRFPVGTLERLRGEGRPVRYVVLGPVVDAEEGRALERELEGRPWASRIEVAFDEVAAALAGADVVLNCSRVEGFSNAVAEALACGRPVVASDIPGNRLALGEAGALYREGDAADFEAKLRPLLGSEARRRALGEAARRSAAERFSLEREADALLEAYGAALAVARPRWRGRTLPVI